MKKEVVCQHDCTCKNSLGHYLAILGGVLRVVSIVMGLVISSSNAAERNPDMTRKHDALDKVVDVVVELAEKLTE